MQADNRMREISLRRRVMWGLLAYSLLLLAAVAAVGVAANQQLERAMWHATLSEQMDHRLSQPGHANAPQIRAQMFVTRPPTQPPPGLPDALRGLPPGLHGEIDVDGIESAVLVRDVDDTRVYVMLDIGPHEREERRWLVSLLLLGVLAVAAVVGLSSWLASRLVRPVTDLADRLASLDPAQRGLRLAGHDAHREVAMIEGAANEFLGRLDGFVQREREFIDTVGHELRTPIAIIDGALDVLAGGEDLPPTARRAVARAHAAVAEMDETLAALLFLAKDLPVPGSEGPCDVALVVAAVVDNHQHLIGEKPLRLCVGELQATPVAATGALVTLAVGNLVRNAIQHSLAGEIQVGLNERVLMIEDSGPGIPPEEISRLYALQVRQNTHRAPGSGIGLYVVGRLCQRLRWTLAVEQRASGGSRVRLTFPRA